MKWVYLVGVIFLLSACQAETQVTTADIINTDYDVIGEVTLTEDAEGVEVEVEVVGLTPGFKGIHIHEIPECEAPAFESAGGHWSIDEEAEHGLMHPDGHHIGDMPNILVEDDGSATYEYVIEDATLLDGQGSFFNEDGGKSLIIHDGPDDGISQPAGDAGDRVACAEITKDDDDDEETDNPAEGEEDEEEEE
ncbi:superoxide dismutase family protein [Alkalibacillus haloalkaliphilus]|uniref:superoxide dismutase family protein n=1 Tax=Alkalibacillus haloalkaliphilus TaxID=94136 RepID=UPI000304CCB0|nr:superoxide dismutase family protein [Alkalibacillus haloalkaliphilus]